MSKKTRRPHHHHERTEARRLALQVLYQSEMVEKAPSAILADKAYVAEEGVPSAYAERLLQGVEEHREEIDDQLRTASENWTLSRMPAVDRALLRMAACEMLYVDEVPLSVSINEAVELAKRFGGGDDSHRFVNGILGRIARGIEAEGAQRGRRGAALRRGPGRRRVRARAGRRGRGPRLRQTLPQCRRTPPSRRFRPKSLLPPAVSAEDAAQE